MVLKEGRLSRWARLKQKGGTGEEEATNVEPELGTAPLHDESRMATSANGDVMLAPDPRDLPGGDFRRNAIPVMAPLGGVEDEDTEFEAASPEAMALLQGDEGHDATPGVPPVDMGDEDGEEQRELTPQEQEVVAGLPPIESLGRDSDFTPFLSEKVPEFIRRKALSVLWRSDPVLANLDGLNDYDEDYNLIDTLINAATQSNYKVGKGMPGPDDEDEEDENVEEVVESEDGEIPQGVADDVVGAEVETEVSEDPEAEKESPEEEDEIPLAQRSIRDVRKPGA